MGRQATQNAIENNKLSKQNCLNKVLNTICWNMVLFIIICNIPGGSLFAWVDLFVAPTESLNGKVSYMISILAILLISFFIFHIICLSITVNRIQLEINKFNNKKTDNDGQKALSDSSGNPSPVESQEAHKPNELIPIALSNSWFSRFILKKYYHPTSEKKSDLLEYLQKY